VCEIFNDSRLFSRPFNKKAITILRKTGKRMFPKRRIKREQTINRKPK
jgi:hypothetical protein